MHAKKFQAQNKILIKYFFKKIFIQYILDQQKRPNIISLIFVKKGSIAFIICKKYFYRFKKRVPLFKFVHIFLTSSKMLSCFIVFVSRTMFIKFYIHF